LETIFAAKSAENTAVYIHARIGRNLRGSAKTLLINWRPFGTGKGGFNGAATPDPVLKAALAHMWFVTIHPSPTAE
jgi:hypothetical protein